MQTDIWIKVITLFLGIGVIFISVGRMLQKSKDDKEKIEKLGESVDKLLADFTELDKRFEVLKTKFNALVRRLKRPGR